MRIFFHSRFHILYPVASKQFFIIVFSFCFYSISLFAQDDLLNMLDSMGTKDKSVNKVTAMFKDPRIINMQTPQTMGAGELNFCITHRFGNIGAESRGGVHTLYGWDAISDVRFSFDYGITDRFQVGIARNKLNENVDGSLKFRLLDQTIDNRIPLSVCAYSIASFTPMLESALYAGADTSWVASNKKITNRIIYTSQIILARKFASWLSIAITPSYTHRNYVLTSVNAANNALDENDIFSVGAGVRVKLTRSFSILADYFYVNSKYRQNNSVNPYYNPLAVGIEIETGGHVFHIDFTNAAGIIENYYIPNSPDSWGKGGYKLGFNISRVFPIVKHKTPKNHNTEWASAQAPAEYPSVAPTPINETSQKAIEQPVVQKNPEKEIYKVTTESLNMRSGAGTNYPLIMHINKGASVELIEKTNADWWKIKYFDETGYVSSKFLSK